MPQYRHKDSPKTIYYRIFSCGQGPSLRIKLGQAAGDDVHLRLCFGERVPWPDVSQHQQRCLSALVLFLVGQNQGRPQLHARRPLKSGRQHTDHRIGPAVKLDRLADDVRIGSKAPLPQTVAEDGDLIPPELPFTGLKGATLIPK